MTDLEKVDRIKTELLKAERTARETENVSNERVAWDLFLNRIEEIVYGN